MIADAAGLFELVPSSIRISPLTDAELWERHSRLLHHWGLLLHVFKRCSDQIGLEGDKLERLPVFAVAHGPYLTTRTGQGAVCSTLWVALPRNKPSRSVRPREPITIMSHFSISATSEMTSLGGPSRILSVN